MKRLHLQNQSFRYLQQSFKEWLDIQGYAASTIKSLPVYIRELLHYLEQEGVYPIQQLNQTHILAHYQKLKIRANQNLKGGLSNAYLNKHIQAIKRFIDYLHLSGKVSISLSELQREETTQYINYLTLKEIQLLFEASYHTPTPSAYISVKTYQALQSRDRAMLAVYYGCGLRSREGVQLDVSDIHFEKGLLKVRKGKNYKQRLVPISKKNLYYLTQYIYDHRVNLLKGRKQEALFISHPSAKRIQAQTLSLRLKGLQTTTQDPELLQKKIGLHTLRHSIATHLMETGMRIEAISRFLGHSSLESTQRYTHLPQHHEL